MGPGVPAATPRALPERQPAYIYGDPTYNVYDGFLNAGYDLGDNVQLYAFGSYGHRKASGAIENYRAPTKVEKA